MLYTNSLDDIVICTNLDAKIRFSELAAAQFPL